MRQFSDNEECPPSDSLFMIQPPVNRLVQRIQSAIIPGKEMCIDETMVTFRGCILFFFAVHKE
jgi:hypothetical protein